MLGIHPFTDVSDGHLLVRAVGDFVVDGQIGNITAGSPLKHQFQILHGMECHDRPIRVNAVNETENGLLVSIHQNTFSDGKYSGAQVFYAAEGESQELAEQLQNTFCQTLNPGSNRRCKRADGVYLMEHIEKTGILVECGFLSNVQEEAKLRRSEYQKKLCCVIAATVCNFLDR